jgi:trehalose-6-phosphate synthase
VFRSIVFRFVLPLAAAAAIVGYLGAPLIERLLAEWSRTSRDYLLLFGAVSGLVVALLGVLTAWLLLRRWVALLVRDIRGRRFLDDAESPRASIPVLSQVRQALREIEQSQRLEIDYSENWTPQALQHVVRDYLQSPQITVVSNREPYIHDHDAYGNVLVQIPASGMVSALEPVMRACSGTWVAHGSGPADRTVVDRFDRVPVPPDDPAYSLRRVWLSDEEEQGYYYGFSNEGLWALCHLAYIRPAFRERDWSAYQSVNHKFAAAVCTEANTDRPVVLIQDFHLALLPRLIRDRKPKATVVLFWHIPWPNAEAFGVCPWKLEMLLHMLSADILGFHTRHHCQNFLATVDRFVECQIDHEHMTVSTQGHVCRVASYPISIEWPPRALAKVPDVATSRTRVCERYGIADSVKIGLGVERWDFTKGIVERFLAIEAFLERNPRMKGRVTLLQIAAPSRSKLPAYQALQHQTRGEAERINARFASGSWQPIVLVDQHQEPALVFELFRAADFCIVNSLHDGMNLVAKEFVAARDDEDGVLILSSFTGASRELTEALPVNPFDVVNTANAIQTAIEMPRRERGERMRLMRATVKENNVYRWAGNMLIDAARIRQRQALVPKEGFRNLMSRVLRRA